VTKVQANRWDGQQWVKVGTMDLTDSQIEGLKHWAGLFNHTTDVAREIQAEFQADDEAGRWQPSKVEYVSITWTWINGAFYAGDATIQQGVMHSLISQKLAQVKEWYDRETNTVTTETPERFKGWGK
jgi:hypothetical protein